MEKIIVSLTSYPKRITTIHKVLDSIIRQTILPDKIILYLSSYEFIGFADMPNFKQYEKYGFEIHWYEENLRSHKKWFYVFQEFPDDIVITVDDDIVYGDTALENLLKYHKMYTKAVIARRVHLITFNKDGTIAPYDKWYMECSTYVGIPRMDFLATTGAGTLFPPHIFTNELFCKDIFMKLCPYADDIWMKIMELYNEVPVVLAEKTWEDRFIIEHQSDCLFINYNNEGGNDIQLRALLEQYVYNCHGRRLKDCIFDSGKIFASKVRELKKLDMENALNQLALKMRSIDRLLIYGAGRIGKKVYNLLNYKNIDNIYVFIVSNVIGNPGFIGSIPVKNYKEFIQETGKIVIALWDIYESHIVCEKLINEGVNKDRIIFLNHLEKQALIELLS